MYLDRVDYQVIRSTFRDFQKHSKCFELPKDESHFIGIYENSKLIGYFIVVGYTDCSIDITHGYLIPEARHKGKPKEAMRLLEEHARSKGYNIIRLQTMNRFKSYQIFMEELGYKKDYIVFSKEVR